MKVALLCSGLGRVHRGHEVFARQLFTLLRDEIDIVLFKGAGVSQDGEIVVESVSRDAPELDGMRLAISPKWEEAAKQVERMRVEGETFAFGALKPLLAGGFDVIHCLEQEVCEVLYGRRHLFRRTPKILFSNGGALASADLPPCDFVQEHTPYNLERSDKAKAFFLPHGVDTSQFHPGLHSDFRARHGIPPDAFVVLSVGTICYWHKRMDYVIREVASVPDAWLVIVGQESSDSEAIKALGAQLMGRRVIFETLPHEKLPEAYAAADVFTLGSIFETFGIVYIEAMAMGLPVVCTNHPNQRAIAREAVFIDVKRHGALGDVLRQTDRSAWKGLGKRGLDYARSAYDIAHLKQEYVRRYTAMSATEGSLPTYSFGTRLRSNALNFARSVRRTFT